MMNYQLMNYKFSVFFTFIIHLRRTQESELSSQNDTITKLRMSRGLKPLLLNTDS